MWPAEIRLQYSQEYLNFWLLWLGSVVNRVTIMAEYAARGVALAQANKDAKVSHIAICTCILWCVMVW